MELLADYAGYKAGLALTREQLRHHLPDCEALDGEDNAVVRVRHEELERLVCDLLFAVGTISRPSGLDPCMALHLKYHRNPYHSAIVQSLGDELFNCTMRAASDAATVGKPIDITPIAERLVHVHGRDGLLIFQEFEALLSEHIHGSFASAFRHTEWKNLEALAGLFDSESLEPAHGTFLDQRFIDYLQRNDFALGQMNWRKFEGLAGEYFVREGFRVEMGKGRGDGGVDLRAWREDANEQGSSPSTVSVQCKRQKDKVEQVVVKALYADVLFEGAESGLVVTTSALQPGAAAVCSGRGYPVQAADRGTLRAWLVQLRSPGTGVMRR